MARNTIQFSYELPYLSIGYKTIFSSYKYDALRFPSPCCIENNNPSFAYGGTPVSRIVVEADTIRTHLACGLTIYLSPFYDTLSD